MNSIKQACARLGRFGDAGPALARMLLGFLFVWHGVAKFNDGIDMVKGMFEMWGVPAPGIAAPLVAVLEIVGGIALIAGFMTRAMSMLLGVVMVGALVLVKSDVGLIPMNAAGAEVDLAYLAGLMALMFVGPGRWSVDAVMGVEPGGVETVIQQRVTVPA